MFWIKIFLSRSNVFCQNQGWEQMNFSSISILAICSNQWRSRSKRQEGCKFGSRQYSPLLSMVSFNSRATWYSSGNWSWLVLWQESCHLNIYECLGSSLWYMLTELYLIKHKFYYIVIEKNRRRTGLLVFQKMLFTWSLTLHFELRVSNLPWNIILGSWVPTSESYTHQNIRETRWKWKNCIIETYTQQRIW